MIQTDILLKVLGKKERTINIIFGALFLISLFIFFRYVHPVVPWDGDDWATIGGFITASDYGIPLLGHYERILPNVMGTIMGYIAAYVVYPWSGDYINSLVIINSIVLTVSIFCSVVMIYRLIRYGLKAKQIHALLGITLFIAIGFLMFKTTDSSIYLYWQYNMCTLYYYSVPSYCASAYIIALIMKESLGESEQEVGLLKQGFLLAVAYLLIFSFVPAATMVAATAFWYLFDQLIKKKGVVQTIKINWFYAVILVLYCIMLYAEFGRTFGSGYLSNDGNLLGGMIVSSQIILGSFLDIHPLVKVLCIVFLGLAGIVWRSKKSLAEITDTDRKYGKLLFVVSKILLIVFLYFVLFGAISPSHINSGNMRMDSMYVFYFLVNLLVVVCAVYLVENSKSTVVWMPMVLCIMAYPTVSPKYSYGESIYTDSTAKQRYEIMTSIVEEAQRLDIEEGQISIRAHIPYTVYGGPIGYILYIHNIIGQQGTIEVVNDTSAPFYMENIK